MALIAALFFVFHASYFYGLWLLIDSSGFGRTHFILSWSWVGAFLSLIAATHLHGYMRTLGCRSWSFAVQAFCCYLVVLLHFSFLFFLSYIYAMANAFSL